MAMAMATDSDSERERASMAALRAKTTDDYNGFLKSFSTLESGDNPFLHLLAGPAGGAAQTSRQTVLPGTLEPEGAGSASAATKQRDQPQLDEAEMVLPPGETAFCPPPGIHLQLDNFTSEYGFRPAYQPSFAAPRRTNPPPLRAAKEQDAPAAVDKNNTRTDKEDLSQQERLLRQFELDLHAELRHLRDLDIITPVAPNSSVTTVVEFEDLQIEDLDDTDIQIFGQASRP
ncbi:uncharacterized protein MONBRDRAFT_5524 [Monosiga brevicollis MX1]|uniref:Uncharacterized protein n=1 Tax=Monosiga brevicollis TaxID=81824 RepID=A9URP9_MONBE|nr:uncharacterized protein MONBRDRAFT_5524 [Monosiga brevicollis MX1]EDQ91643.1 predicted protein [Monosiga brevicollis MX1]|eukprot:XP_001742929.1 hypothetical protein [Monosiga brevicollis MX1]